MVDPRTAPAGDQAGAASRQTLIRLASGLLVLFAAFGFGSWFSGAASWVGFYLGARGTTLAALAQVSIAVGFSVAVVFSLAWYARRCLRGRADIPGATAFAACLVLPVGNIFWAIFVDAIAYHHGEDVVRPTFDIAAMYLMLGGLVPLVLGVPWLVFRLAGQRTGPRATRPG